MICLVTWLKLKHFGTIWNLLVNLLWLLNCRVVVLPGNSQPTTLKVAIYIGRMAVEDASCVVDDISVLCC